MHSELAAGSGKIEIEFSVLRAASFYPTSTASEAPRGSLPFEFVPLFPRHCPYCWAGSLRTLPAVFVWFLACKFFFWGGILFF